MITTETSRKKWVFFTLGCSRKNLHPLTDEILEILAGGGSKALEILLGGGVGLNLKKSSAGVILTDSSCDLNI